MLAYAAHYPRPAGRAGSPSSLVLVLAGHAVVIGAVMTAKMDLVGLENEKPPIVFTVPKPPPEPEPRPLADPKTPQLPLINKVTPIVPVEQLTPTYPVYDGRLTGELPQLGGGGGGITLDPLRHTPVRIAARPMTSDSALKPPYPNNKIRDGEEASLKLRLTIDARGRVTAVDPVGSADPSFLEAARRHIIRVWRYKPATEDGVAVPSSTVINLSFRLEDV